MAIFQLRHVACDIGFGPKASRTHNDMVTCMKIFKRCDSCLTDKRKMR